jgi:ATP-dependent RNA helicase DDX49/DBP8
MFNAAGLKHPTPIQNNCIPRILAGDDCIGCAKTGSGKTFAFALPILQKLCEEPYGIFALVLTPTRELAFQVQWSVIFVLLSFVFILYKVENMQNCDFADCSV